MVLKSANFMRVMLNRAYCIAFSRPVSWCDASLSVYISDLIFSFVPVDKVKYRPYTEIELFF